MTTIKTVDFKQQTTTSSNIKQRKIKEDDNIFASYARKAGMENFADFLRDDWTANMARKAGNVKFADWLENKPNEDSTKSYNDGFFSNFAREMIKHPVITITAIAGAIFAGRGIHKALTKAPANAVTTTTAATATTTTATTATATTAANTIAETKVAVKPISEQIDGFNKTIDNYIHTKGKDSLKDFEIFEKLTPQEQEKIWNYISHDKVHREKELLLFASGNKPATLEGYGSYTADLFDCLQKNKAVHVAEYFDTDNFNLLMNVDATKKVIGQNQAFFISRLDLPANSTVDDIFNTIKKGYGNRMSDPNKFLDIKQLLQGNTKENAYYLQMVEDIRNIEKTKYFEAGYQTFSERSNEGIDIFKQILKEKLNLESSSYKNMPESFRKELTQIIDNIRPEDYNRRILYKDCLILNDEYYNKQLTMLQNLAQRIKEAELTGAKISLSGGCFS
jgi:hypothetical protein